MASASKQSARGRIGDKLDESKACVCSGFSHFEHIELRPLPGGCLRLTLNMRTSTMAPTKQDQPDLNALENQGQVDGALGAGRSSSKSIAHSIPKSQEQTITEEKPISEALVVENDCTSLGSKPKDDRIGRQPKWWLSLIQWSKRESTSRYKRMVVHLLLVVVILGWWISGLALKRTRHKWVITTFWTWLILMIIFFRWVPTKYVARPIGNTYMTLIGRPVMKLTNERVRLGIGWSVLLGLWLASTFGIKLGPGNSYKDRLRSLFGVIIFQLCFWASSKNKSLIRWRTVVVGLILQQLLALVVLKSKAGYDFFNWIATAATDILDQGTKAGGFFFSPEVVQNHWFFVNTLAAIIFFIALVQLLYYFGIMQAVMVKFAWVFYTLMGVSGVEAVVAAASPFVGQGESVILIRPFAAQMTAAEIHQVMASGFSTIAGSVLTAYVAMGIPAVYLISASIMSIPASLAISKLRFPEDSRPLTAGQVVIPEDEQNNPRDSNPLMTFSDGAWLGLRVAGMILANLLTILALLYTVDGLLTWIGQFWGMDPNGTHPLTLELIFQYVLYPVAWLMGTPNQDVLKVSRLLALKLITNEFVAYQELSKLRPEMTERGILIAIYGLCGFANLGSMGIQIGVLNSLVPSKKDVISRVAISALLCGFFSTIQTAAIAGMIF
ncbi:hypothetical protein PSTG_06630 [Puccinia striiformis f. sp. tritici PST-78]|uniref:Concentrative nucleoside transporter C-terminal domain-containing protein n=1 Tax=Puccinia striiformis f. sp. tritici PST-78 TaxID=1165861 RepID=A0A0L0VLT1_9BASI|nr:hypothetical protein PSTG_06630 [Puccinia striiformis f. sp. tritici PST-78]